MNLILGNISFSGFSDEENKLFKNPDSEGNAIVHEVYGIIDCSQVIGEDPKKLATKIGEDLCNTFLSYIIPAVWEGEVVFERIEDKKKFVTFND